MRGTVTAHHEHAGRAFSKVSIESFVKIASVVNSFMSAGFGIAVDSGDSAVSLRGPDESFTEISRAASEVVDHPARRGSCLQCGR